MSSFYDDASLVMIPSGYKNAKIYCEKPTDGSGDLTFTRASNATRVASNGLIEKVRTNLLTYSQDFSNAAWNKNNVTLTSGQTDPNGGATATRVDATNTASAYVRQSLSITSGVKYTWSIYIKGSTSGQSIALYTDGASNIYEVKNLTTSWQRFTGVATATSTGASGFYVLCGSGYSGLTDLPFDIAFAQVEASDIATDYIATTTAAVSVGPVSGLPRLDYLNSSCPRLLLEPQRTNLLTYSEQFDNAAWTKQTGITITANTTETLDPSGYYGADKVVSTNGSTGFFQAGLSLNTTLSYTRTIYLKGAVGGETLKLKDPSGFGPTTNVTLTNSWQRYEHKTTATGDAYQGLWVDDISNGATIYAWGAQLEAGAYATSYIPTLSTSVTRVADLVSKTGISSLIGQTEGTIFLDVRAVLDTTTNQDYSVSDGTTSNRALIRLNTSGLINAIGVFGGSIEFNMGTTPYTAGSRYKIALAYKLNDIALYVNGVQAATDNTATISGTLSRFGFDVGTGVAPIVSPVNQALLFKTRLTNAQLAELTTL